MKGRRRKLKVTKIIDRHGNTINSSEQIRRVAVEYYHELFSASPMQDWLAVMDNIPTLITQEKNDRMVSMPTKNEVNIVVDCINRDSTSGPDDFIGFFFKIARRSLEGMSHEWYCLSSVDRCCLDLPFIPT